MSKKERVKKPTRYGVYSSSFFIPILLIVLFFIIVVARRAEAPLVTRSEYPSVLTFGDVMFDRGVRNIIENRGRDPFEYIKKDSSTIKQFDVVLVNLEGPIVEMDRNLCQSKAYNFQFSLDTPTRLKDAGINIVNIANNHFYDCYVPGYESTKNALMKAGIDYIGDFDLPNSFIIKNIKGKKIAFMGMDETVQMTPLEKFYPLVKKLKAENDYVVVDIHWGTEYSLTATEVQKNIAHILIDNGADVIFGGHPHVVEPVEIYKGKVIFYSLGNFVFDQTDPHTTDGLGAAVQFAPLKTVFTLFPYNIKLFAPDLVKGDIRNSYCDVYLKGLTHDGCSFEINK